MGLERFCESFVLAGFACLRLGLELESGLGLESEFKLGLTQIL
jgi:hypothetical protein